MYELYLSMLEFLRAHRNPRTINLISNFISAFYWNGSYSAPAIKLRQDFDTRDYYLEYYGRGKTEPPTERIRI